MNAKRSRGKTFAIADVGSGSVACAIIVANPEGAPEIICAQRQSLPLEKRDEAHAASAIESLFPEVTQAVADEYAKKFLKQHGAISDAYAIIRAPWTHSKTIAGAARFETDTRITSPLIAKLAQESLAKEDTWRARLLEANVTRIELNGYPTPEPEGKRARDISVISLISDCDPDIRKSVEEGMARTFSIAHCKLRSGTRALVATLSKTHRTSEDYLIVDMGADASVLLALHEGVAAEQAVVPEGASSILLRAFPSKTGDEILSLLRMMNRGECDSGACQEITEALAKAEPDLARSFGETMAGMIGKRRLPNALVLVAHPDLLPWLSQFFARIDFAQFTATTQPFSVVPLTSADVPGKFADPKNASDIDLALDAAFVNMSVNES